MKRILLAFVITGLLHSCAYHSGMISHSGPDFQNVDQTYVDIAAGYSKASYFLNIGGLSKDAMINDAKRNLYLSYPLDSNQIFKNMTYDSKISRIGPYKKQEVVVIADVVEYDTSLNISYSDQYKQWLSENKNTSNELFTLNENVLVYKHKNVFPGRIIGLNKNKITVFYIGLDGQFNIRKLPENDIFSTSDIDYHLVDTKIRIGKNVLFYKEDMTSGMPVELEGKIIALNKTRGIIEASDKQVMVKLSELRFE